MRIKYSPCKAGRDSVIAMSGPESVTIDGEAFEFAPADVEWPGISELTGGAIVEAHREGGELCLTVRRFYQGNCTEWDTGDYHEVTA